MSSQRIPAMTNGKTFPKRFISPFRGDEIGNVAKNIKTFMKQIGQKPHPIHKALDDLKIQRDLVIPPPRLNRMVVHDPTPTALKRALSEYRGRSVRVQHETLDKIYHVPLHGWSRAFDHIVQSDWLHKNTDTGNGISYVWRFDRVERSPLVLSLLRGVNADPNRRFGPPQSFRDAVVGHCVFDRIIDWAAAGVTTASSKHTDKKKADKAANKYSTVLEEALRLKEFYADGVPETHLQNVADKLKCTIELSLPLLFTSDKDKQVRRKYVPATIKKPKQVFSYLNTRTDHVEPTSMGMVGHVLGEGLPKDPVSDEEFDAFRQRLDDARSFYGFKRSKDQVVEILTASRRVVRSSCNTSAITNLTYHHAIHPFVGSECDLDNTNPIKSSLGDMQICDRLDNMRGPDPDGDDAPGQEAVQIFDLEKPLPETYDMTAPLAPTFQSRLLSNFVKSGCHFPLSKAFIDTLELDDSEIHAIDMKRAYTQFSANPDTYQGFMGRITDFRQCNEIHGLGMYRIDHVSYERVECPKMRHLLEIMCPVLSDRNVYPSPQLEYLDSFGVSFDIVEGCWGSEIDFEFPEYMFQKTSEGKPLYAMWTGMQTCSTSTQSINIVCEPDYLETIKSYAPHNRVTRTSEVLPNGMVEATIAPPKEAMPHLTHISAFITAYMYMNVIDQLREMDLEQVLFLNSDGIFYRPHKFPILERRNGCLARYQGNPEGDRTLWKHEVCSTERLQRAMTYACRLNSCFHHTGDDDTEHPDMPVRNGVYPFVMSGVHHRASGFCLTPSNETTTHFMETAHLGAAGTGKSYSVIRNDGFCRVGYMTLGWRLCRKTEEEHEGRLSMVEVKEALFSDPRRVRDIRRKCNVLVIDEISALTESDKLAIQRQFANDLKLLWAGDISPDGKCYQLPPVCPGGEDTGKSMSVRGMHIVTHIKNHRFGNDKPLMSLASKIRNMITKDVSVSSALALFRRTLEDSNLSVSYEDMVSSYRLEDDVICARNSTKDRVTSDLKPKFAGGLRKFTIKSNCHKTKRSNGEVLISREEPKGVKSEEQYAYTCHAMQGETLRKGSILYVDTVHMTSVQHLYVTLTRCRSLDQLRLVTVPNEDDAVEGKVGLIYRVYNRKRDQSYIGHTFLPSVELRLAQHWSQYKKHRHSPSASSARSYCTSWILFNRARQNHVTIHEVSRHDNISRTDLIALEQQAIEACPNAVNKLHGHGGLDHSGLRAQILGASWVDSDEESDGQPGERVYVEPVNCRALERAIDTAPSGQDGIQVATRCLKRALETLDADTGVGELHVRHKKRKYGEVEYGRRYADGDSLQKLPKYFRHPAMKGFHRDIDVVNAHPVLLSQLIRREGIQCSTSHLSRYLEERELMLKAVMDAYGVSRAAAKELFIRLLYGGSILAWRKDHHITYVTPNDPTILDVETEFHATQNAVVTHLGLKNKFTAPKDTMSSYLSLHLQEIENQILQAAEEYIDQVREDYPSLRVQCLMWDGFTVPKDSMRDDNEMRGFLDGLQEYIRDELGWDLRYEEKLF